MLVLLERVPDETCSTMQKARNKRNRFIVVSWFNYHETTMKVPPPPGGTLGYGPRTKNSLCDLNFYLWFLQFTWLIVWTQLQIYIGLRPYGVSIIGLQIITIVKWIKDAYMILMMAVNTLIFSNSDEEITDERRGCRCRAMEA